METIKKDINDVGQINQTHARFENVATALYLVTNHLPESEPLKLKVREITQTVLEEIINISDISTKTIFDRLAHIRSLLKIASITGMMSKQNVGIIDSEILHIQGTLKDTENSSANLAVSIGKVLMLDFVGETFAENFDQNQTGQDAQSSSYVDHSGTSINRNLNRSTSGNPATQGVQRITTSNSLPSIRTPQIQNPNTLRNNSVHPNNINRDNKDRLPAGQVGQKNISEAGRPAQSVRSVGGQTIADRGQLPNMGQVQKKPENQNLGNVNKVLSTGISDRQNLIIREIRNKGQLTIRDLVGKIQGCSEKTIQRDLLSLVDAGMLLKEGERRWSKYSAK